MFQPFPSEVFFQKFEPFETYEVPLTLRNNDKVIKGLSNNHNSSHFYTNTLFRRDFQFVGTI